MRMAKIRGAGRNQNFCHAHAIAASCGVWRMEISILSNTEIPLSHPSTKLECFWLERGAFVMWATRIESLCLVASLRNCFFIIFSIILNLMHWLYSPKEWKDELVWLEKWKISDAIYFPRLKSISLEYSAPSLTSNTIFHSNDSFLIVGASQHTRARDSEKLLHQHRNIFQLFPYLMLTEKFSNWKKISHVCKYRSSFLSLIKSKVKKNLFGMQKWKLQWIEKYLIMFNMLERSSLKVESWEPRMLEWRIWNYI